MRFHPLGEKSTINTFKADELEAAVIAPAFKKFKDETYRFVTINAKKARGLMCNNIIQNKLERIEDLKSFDSECYQYNQKISSDHEWVFTRRKIQT